VIEEFEYKNHTVKIVEDDDAESSREWDNVGTMACWHRRYTLGDVQPNGDIHDHMCELICEYDPGFEERLDRRLAQAWDKMTRDISFEKRLEESARIGNAAIEKAFDKYYISLPLYLYDHSGITMNTTGFSCPWDSGQVGIIYVKKEDAKKEWEKQRLSKKVYSQVEQQLKAEVETYDMFLCGQVYGFEVYDADGEITDSCYGYYGLDYCISEAKAVLDCEPDTKEVA